MLSRLRRVWRARRRDDRGITLGELVVSSTITMMMLAVATSWIIQVNRDGSSSVVSNQTTGDARNALQSWTGMLRVANWLDTNGKTDRFEEVTPTKIVFYANILNLPTTCPTNNVSACRVTNAPTKIALSLVDSGNGFGRLIEVVFGSDNTTVARVRTVALYASKTGGAPIFQPYFRTGGIAPLSPSGCLDTSTNTSTTGLCLSALPSNVGMLDPTVSADGVTVSSGSLRGNPANVSNGANTVDQTLQAIGGIQVNFTVSAPATSSSMAFSGAASVYSGFTS